MRFLCVLLIFFATNLNAQHTQPLRVGIIKFYPPFEIQVGKGNEFTGFDRDLIMALCLRMKRECSLKPMVFRDIFPSLDAGEIDLAISAISITKQRAEFYLFSLPYLASYVQFLALKTSNIDINQLEGKTIGLLTGAIGRVLLKEAHGDKIKIKEYVGLNNLLIDLSNKKIDLALIDYFAALYWAASNNQYKTVGNKLVLGVGYGIVSQKDRKDLIQAINGALIEMESDGSYLKLYNKYFGSKL